jgi:ABC-type lipoprotein release transport system permease subunit
MGLLIRISLRNLLRQKRRNLLLGTAMAIGMAILAIANAFSHGISDVLFNRILTYVAGHVTVAMAQGSDITRPVFHDGPRLDSLIRAAAPQALTIQEGVGILARAIGNGKSDNIVLIGMDPTLRGTQQQQENLKADFRMRQGTFDDVLRTDIENPALLSADKAAYLNAKVGDLVRVRFTDIHGRRQAVRLTVVGIFSPANIFMSVPVFVERSRLKALAGYEPGDLAQVSLSLSDPKKQAVPVADALHAALAPPLAMAYGRLEAGGRKAAGSKAAALALGFLPDSSALRGLSSALSPGLTEGRSLLSRSDVLMGAALAQTLGVKPGDTVRFAYAAKRASAGSGDSAFATFTLTGIIPAISRLPANVLLVNDKQFYAFYYSHWPAPPPAGSLRPDTTGIGRYLDQEWILLPRTRTTEELQLKRRDIARFKTKAASLDVQTMYESASMVIKLEYALNLITLAAVLILFFIIQVGVVNTLRMTIRERTREIGTIRAIGMQRGQVRAIFLLETFFLSMAACVAGIGLAFAGMAGLGRLTFRAEGNPLSMLLVEGHPHFQPSVLGTAAYLLIILAIAVATAWFPARRAANLHPADALRHFG